MNESLIKYLAGLYDADGSISFSFRLGRNTTDHYYLSLHLSLATSDVVDRHRFIENLAENEGLGSFHRYGAEKQYCTWLVNSRSDVEMFLPRLIKYMLVKAGHGQRMLEKWREKRGKLLSAGECEDLKNFSRSSRFLNPGPIKPKNHPSWSWLAGYLDGNGSYIHFLSKGAEYKGKRYPQWLTKITAACHANDADVLWFIQSSLGGSIFDRRPKAQTMVLTINLGPKNASLAKKILPKLARHARMKRHKIDQMISYHQQRLSAPTPAGEATV